MIMIIPQRYTKEIEYKSRVYKKIFLGSQDDTSNFNLSQTPTWDATKQDYKIEDRVKIELLNTEYVCGEDGNTKYPPSSAMWKGVTLNEHKYADSAPNRKSFFDSEQGVIESNLTDGSNYLFIQNTENIQKIKVEAYGENNELIPLNGDGEWMEELLQFSCCDCCATKIVNKINYTLSLQSCGGFTKIRTTLIPYIGKLGKVGTHAVGEMVDLGCLIAYPSVSVDSTTKYTVVEDNLEITEGSKYVEVEVRFKLQDRGMLNTVIKKLSENIGKICFYDLQEFKEIDMVKVTGFHKSVKPDFRANEISMQIYGVPSY